MTDPSDPLAELEAGVRGILCAHSEHEDVLHRDLFLAVATAAEDVTRCGRVLEELVPRLEALRGAKIPSLRLQAMRLMGHLMCRGHEPAQAYFLTWLEARTRRDETLQALEDVLRPSAPAGLRETLLVQLDTEDTKERLVIIRLLAVLVGGDERVRDALLARTQDKNLEVAAAAVQALASVVDRDAGVRQALLSRFVQRGTALERRYHVNSVRGAITAVLGAVLGRHAEVREAFLARLAHEPPHPKVAESLGAVAAGDGEVREALLARLAQGSADTRREIIRALAGLASRDQQVRDALLARLDDEEQAVREVVIGALGTGAVHDARVRDALLARLDDEDESIRIAVLDALGAEMASDARVRDVLLAQLDAGARGSRLPAAHVQGAVALHDERVRQALLRRLTDALALDSSGVLRALQAGVGLHEDVRDAFLSRLDNMRDFPDQELLRVLAPLWRHDEKVRRALDAWLEGTLPSLRWRSIELLAPWAGQDEQVRALLLSLLEDEEGYARSCARKELAAFAESHADVRRALLAKLRGEKDDWVRSELIRALAPAARSDKKVRHALLARRKTRSPEVSRAVAWVLRSVVAHAPEVRHAYLEDLHHKNDLRTAAAVFVLSGLVEQDEDVRHAVAARLADPRFSKPKKVYSVVPLRSNTPGVRVNGLARVSRSEDRGVLLGLASPYILGPLASSHDETRQALLAQLEDPREDVRTRTLQALSPAAGRHVEVRDALLARLDDEQPTVRRSAAGALGPLVAHDAGVRHALLARFQGTERHETFVCALGPAASLDPEVRAALVAVLGDENREVRRSAVAALGGCVDAHPEVRQGLLARLDDVDWAVRATVVKTLVEHSPALLDTERVLLPWLGAMSDSSESMWDREDEPLPLLCREVRRAVARRVAQLARQEDALIDRLAEGLRHPAWVVREGAAMALLSMPEGPPPRAASALKGLLSDFRDEDSWKGSLAAMEVLLNQREWRTSQVAVHQVMRALDHGTPPWQNGMAMSDVRTEAARLLGRLEPTHRDEQLLQRLLRLMREEAWEDTREVAYRAVTRLLAAPPRAGSELLPAHERLQP